MVSSVTLHIKGKEKERHIVAPVTILEDPWRGNQSGRDEENNDNVSPEYRSAGARFLRPVFFDPLESFRNYDSNGNDNATNKLLI